MLRIVYSLLIYFVIPILLVRQLWRSRIDSGHRQRIAERLGFVVPVTKAQTIVHFHLVSVGETLASLPLINQCLNEHPDMHLHVTCTTLTGSREITKRLGDRVSHSYLPYDSPTAMNRFYRRIPACVSVVMETELWPNMIRSAKRHQCPVMIMNARLSERSARRYRKLPKVRQLLIDPIDKICCQTHETLAQFKTLGASQTQLEYTGNLKFDMDLPETLQADAQSLRNALGQERPVWIAGSTHAGEDEILLEAHTLIKQSIPNAVMILVPRHPERFNDVSELAKARFNTGRQSQNAADADIDVLIGDTMGELLVMYKASDVAFVGGSLVARGGHNPLEPAILERPVVSGPHVFNFSVVYDMLDQHNAVCWADSAQQIATTVTSLLQSQEQRQNQVERALQIVKQHQGAKVHTLNVILGYVRAHN
ncbi:lipid IV(A) 3-deoxy-D-manno-octulosonic acid transferase [Echinimonas agarilytica]|uniref:3-deoxy-D-manno-octulosonic acid transferase n=1 Tax=Echinimonas agarilytica TaxID=1215918 RepID=A0AA41WA23_9GAMM|nr:lipid IV(A) 3-deoxy-D-manno-octulosonic acid transferase [Echinimonas agarilytica]MCM2680811.1 lipid IV(A) 3-deoxy-D-manno-octulosonic acid transferase [Echinimonas agarilytica]